MQWSHATQNPRLGFPYIISVETDRTTNLESSLADFRRTSVYFIQEINKSEQGNTLRWDVTLIFFQSGTQPLPPLPQQTAPQTITVEKLAQFEEHKDEAKELKASPSPQSLPTPWVEFSLILLALLLIIGALVLWLIKLFKKPLTEAERFERTFGYKAALNRYTQEVAQGAHDAAALKRRSFAASELLRGYAQCVTRHPFLELSSDEIERRQGLWISSAGTLKEPKAFIAFLKQLDVLKFATDWSALEKNLQDPTSFFAPTKLFLDQLHELEQR